MQLTAIMPIDQIITTKMVTKKKRTGTSIILLVVARKSAEASMTSIAS